MPADAVLAELVVRFKLLGELRHDLLKAAGQTVAHVAAVTVYTGLLD